MHILSSLPGLVYDLLILGAALLSALAAWVVARGEIKDLFRPFWERLSESVSRRVAAVCSVAGTSSGAHAIFIWTYTALTGGFLTLLLILAFAKAALGTPVTSPGVLAWAYLGALWVPGALMVWSMGRYCVRVARAGIYGRP